MKKVTLKDLQAFETTQAEQITKLTEILNQAGCTFEDRYNLRGKHNVVIKSDTGYTMILVNNYFPIIMNTDSYEKVTKKSDDDDTPLFIYLRSGGGADTRIIPYIKRSSKVFVTLHQYVAGVKDKDGNRIAPAGIESDHISHMTGIITKDMIKQCTPHDNHQNQIFRSGYDILQDYELTWYAYMLHKMLGDTYLSLDDVTAYQKDFLIRRCNDEVKEAYKDVLTA